MSTNRLVLSLPAHRVGALDQRRGGLIQWVPEPSWEEAGQYPRLGLEFLRTPGRRSASSELPAWFENLLPERGSALRSRLCDLYELREGASFPLLRALGTDLPGAVEARADGASPSDVDHGSNRDGTAVSGPDQPASEDAVSLSSLPGMQLKFSMSMVNDRLTLAARAGARLWIVKLPGREYDELAEVETATMTWAARAGFVVPAHRTVPFDALDGIPDWAELAAPAFAIERFDRRPDGSKVHHEDLCQALGLRPGSKNGDGRPGVRFEGALRLVHDAGGENEGREMARRLGFMIASGNGDAHLKNWGLIWGDRVRPSLAPCYDLVATIAWERFGWTRRGGPRLALRFGTTRRFADLDQQMLDVFATKSGHPWAKEEIISGISRARAAFRDIDVSIPERMRSALADHWSRVPILKHLGQLPAS